jgi:transcriptional regulator with XRE-family HTH domain
MLTYLTGEVNVDNTKRAVDPICRAVHKVRLAVGDTQQEFAGRLNMAISTVVRYELTRPPKGEVLVQFMKLAEANGRPDLAEQFWDALHQELGLDLNAGRVVDDCLASVSIALGYIQLINPGTDAERKRKERAVKELAEVRAKLSKLDPYGLIPTPEVPK